MLKAELVEQVVHSLCLGDVERAVDVWREGCSNDDKCHRCFYADLEEKLRCSTCLEVNLLNLILKRSYGSAEKDEVLQAYDHLKQRNAVVN